MTDFSAPGIVSAGHHVGWGWTAFQEKDVDFPELVQVQEYFLGAGSAGDAPLLRSANFPKLVKTGDYFLAYARVSALSCPKLVSFGIGFLQGSRLASAPPIPAGMTEIPNRFLQGSTALNSPIVVPEGVGRIGDNFLSGCSSFNSEVTLPSTLTTIGIYFLYNCSSFNKSLSIPNSVSTIGNSFLRGCVSFDKDLSIPSGVQSIGTYFMNKCDNFQHTVNFGDISPTIIASDNYAFSTDSTSVPVYAQGFHIMTSNASAFTSRFPDRTSSPYRRLVKVDPPEPAVNYIVTTDNDTIYFPKSQSINLRGSTSATTVTLNDETIPRDEIKEVHIIQNYGNSAALGDYYCANCPNLTVIELPQTVTTVGNGFLYHCTSFNQVLPTLQVGQSFLEGCTSFNKPISTATYDVPANFLKDCTSFNSPIIFTRQKETGNIRTVNEGFLYNCISFNQPIDFTQFSYFYGGKALYNCKSFNQDFTLLDVLYGTSSNTILEGCDNFTSTVTANRSAQHDIWSWGANSFTTTNANSPMKGQGFVVQGTYVTNFEAKFKQSTLTSPYRNYTYVGWPYSMQFDSSSATVSVGANTTLTITTTPTGAWSNQGSFSYTSNNPQVVTVENGGTTPSGGVKCVVTGVSAGYATITATHLGSGATATIMVTAQAVVATQYGQVKYYPWYVVWDGYGDNCDLNNVDSGDLIQRCTSDIETIKSFISAQLPQILYIFASLISGAIQMASINIGIMLITFCVIPINFLASLIYFKYVSRKFDEIEKVEANMITCLEENVNMLSNFLICRML